MAMLSEDENRKRILDKGKEYFLSLGYSRVTMSEIADELGMSKKTLYKFFDNKHKLLEEVLLETLTGLSVSLQELHSDQSLTFEEKIRRSQEITQRFVQAISSSALADIRRKTPKIWNQLEHWRENLIRSTFLHFLKEGMDKGVFRNDIDLEMVVFFHESWLDSLFESEIKLSRTYSLHELFDQFNKLFYQGLLTDKARRGGSPLASMTGSPSVS